MLCQTYATPFGGARTRLNWNLQNRTGRCVEALMMNGSFRGCGSSPSHCTGYSDRCSCHLHMHIYVCNCKVLATTALEGHSITHCCAKHQRLTTQSSSTELGPFEPHRIATSLCLLHLDRGNTRTSCLPTHHHGRCCNGFSDLGDHCSALNFVLNFRLGF